MLEIRALFRDKNENFSHDDINFTTKTLAPEQKLRIRSAVGEVKTYPPLSPQDFISNIIPYVVNNVL